MFPALAANALNVNDILQKLQGAAHVVKGAALTAGGFVAKHITESAAVGIFVTSLTWTTISGLSRSKSRSFAREGSVAREMDRAIRNQLLQGIVTQRRGRYSNTEGATVANVEQALQNVQRQAEQAAIDAAREAYDALYEAHNPFKHSELKAIVHAAVADACSDAIGKQADALIDAKLDLEQLGKLVSDNQGNKTLQEAVGENWEKLQLAEALAPTLSQRVRELKPTAANYNEKIEALRTAIGDFKTAHSGIDVSPLEEATSLLGSVCVAERAAALTSGSSAIRATRSAIGRLAAIAGQENKAAALTEEQKTEVIAALEELRPVASHLTKERIDTARKKGERSTASVAAPVTICALLAIGLVATKYFIAPRYFPDVKWLQL